MSESEARSGRVLELAEEFLERYRKGERPPLREYIERHPELAAEIQEIFPAMAMLEKIAVVDESLEVEESRARSQAPPGLVQLGDYRIIREIGHGGMGVVYEAEQVSLGRHVALKVLPHRALANAKTRKRFEREARAAAKLHHTNIVPVFGVGEHDGLPYFAMQFIQGTGLDVVIKELARLQPGSKSDASPTQSVSRRDASAIAKSMLTGAYHATDSADPAPTHTALEPALRETSESPSARTVVPPLDRSSGVSSLSFSGMSDSSSGSRLRKLTYWQSVARVGVQIADALEYAHKQGIVHRDIKPSNLLLDMAGTVWITDFGLAKTDDQENLTRPGDVLGTYRYMPPEAFAGQGDARGDVYSLGVTLYEMVALRPAFDETDRNKLIMQVTTSEPPPVGRVRSGVPRDLETIIHKATEREPARRYQKAEELAEDLRRFLEDRPIKARRISTVERLARWRRRNPMIAVSLAAVACIFLTAFVLVSWSYFRAESARQVAVQREKSERWERYRSSLIAIGSAMQLHNITAAQSALDAAPAEHRNWEWRYFKHQLDTAEKVIRFGDGIRAIAVSPDCTLAAVQSASGPVQLWNLGTGQNIGTLPHDSPATWLGFSPDNKTLISRNGKKFILWDVTAERERAVLSLPDAEFLDRQFSPDGVRLVIACGNDRTARVWDTATGKQLLVLRGHEGPVVSAVFSPDGRRIASVGDLDRTVRVWDAETGKSVTVLSPHDSTTSLALFSPQGDRVLTVEAYPGNALRLWDAATGKLLAVMRGHTNAAEKVAFSPDGSRIASGGLDRTIRLWDGNSGQALASREGHRGAITNLAFNQDGKYLLSTSLDQTARLWDAATGAPLGVLHGHTGSISIYDAARYTPDGRTIVTASAADGAVRFWDARRAEWNGALRGHDSFVYDVAFHPDRARVASGAWDGTVCIWDATTGRQLSRLSYPSTHSDNERIVLSVAFHPAGKLVACFARDGAVRFWDLTTAKEAFCFQLPPECAFDWETDCRVAFSSRGTLLAAPGGRDNSVRLWDVDRRAEVAMLKGHTSWVLESCFSPDDSWLATAGHDRTVRIWDVAKQEQLQVLEGHTDPVQTLAVSPDGKWLASGSLDGTVRLWDTHSWKQVEVLKHGTNVYGVAFTPDGTRLACACADNLIRLWDMTTHQLVAELDGHAAYVHQIAFSPDGTRLVSGSGDHTVRIWDSLSVQERAKRAAESSSR